MNEIKVIGERLPLLPTSELTQAEIDDFKQKLTLANDSIHTQEWREYTAVFPHIIGWVPEGEREFFTQIASSREGGRTIDFGRPDSIDTIDFINGMPVTMSTIQEKLAALREPKLKINIVKMETNVTKAGDSPRPVAKDWHIDPTLSFLISSYGGTNFYSGRAKARFKYFGEVDRGSLVESPLITSAPPFAIVIKGPWDVHKSPTFKKEGTRSFMDVITNFGKQ